MFPSFMNENEGFMAPGGFGKVPFAARSSRLEHDLSRPVLVASEYAADRLLLTKDIDQLDLSGLQFDDADAFQDFFPSGNMAENGSWR
jgi:hypothetical protein